MTGVAFIGLGTMGGPMAKNLIVAGESLTGFDISASARRTAADLGINLAASLTDAGTGANIVITMLQNGEQVVDVWRELLPLASHDTLFVDCSTIDIERCRLAHELAHKAGIKSVDAPVSGGVTGAREHNLTFMCGAQDDAFVAANPILKKWGRAFCTVADQASAKRRSSATT